MEVKLSSLLAIKDEHKKNNGALAEWLCSGLQIRGPRFDSGRRLHYLIKP
ncbi:protein of unknown function [Vibrio tapetis subsp. tapetis]|uniref:Uncharacterized protein n=1 Tax=Vibrio tapetis subsp. tapetis TaxID=1671868 RepID=A0A2N8ZLM5_9VIBR|nr:protein of unknown function [Vibrio tapetis subsp. tapetis]